MHVLIQFELICQNLSDLRTGCSWQGDGEKMSRRLRGKNEAAGKKEKENEETEKKKLKIWDLRQIDGSKGPSLGKISSVTKLVFFHKSAFKS